MTRCRLCGVDLGLPAFVGPSVSMACRACAEATATPPKRIPIGAEVEKTHSPARVKALNAARRWENLITDVVGRAEGARF